MSLWQITKNSVPTGEVLDDGIWAKPGEDGFSQDDVKARASKLGAGYSFNYIGRTPTAEPPPSE